MTAKQFLGRARWADKEIVSLMRTRDETFDRLTHITQSYDGDGAQATKDPHKFDSYVALEQKLYQMIDDLCDIKLEIINVLSQLKDTRELMILKSYYVDLKTWERTAADCGLSWTHTMRLRKSAIKNVEAVLNGITHL
jgi:DNA-directed RNA polymerase specialized sigma subunit